MFKKMFTFKGGVKLPGKKHLSRESPIESMPLPKRVVVPLWQHAGSAAKACVTIGQRVRAGQPIGLPGGVVSAPVHASISGVVVEIIETALAGGTVSRAIVIQGSGEDDRLDLPPIDKWESADPASLLGRIDAAGVVGLGGAAFPSKVKLSPPPGKTVDTLLINGAECEPYLTADYRLMVERADEVVVGIGILLRVLGVSKAVIGIEAHAALAIKAMREAASSNPFIAIRPLKVKYPQGAEKMLIKALVNREVPSGGLPVDVGVIVHNIGTTLAVYQAICLGRTLIERVVTVSGEAIAQPKNLLTRIGTPVADLIDACGGATLGEVMVIAGGPMMGCALSRLDIPVVKGTSGIIVLPQHKETPPEDMVCIKCGRCYSVCPLGLSPSELADCAERGLLDEARRLGVLDCCNCGACSAICPGRRKNSEIIRRLKAATFKVEK
jgi:electron transport complex protein RnfC